MLSLTAAQIAALELGQVMRRDFVWIEARDPVTGLPAPAGFWNDLGTVTVSGKDYYGSGTLGEAASIAAKSDLSIPGMQLTMSGLDPAVAATVRGESVGQAPVTLSLGIFDVATRLLIGPLIPRFVGKVDDIQINTPAQGGTSTITLICESTSRALTVSSTDTRSQESQVLRSSTDNFCKYTVNSRNAPVYFGRKDQRPKNKNKR